MIFMTKPFKFTSDVEFGYHNEDENSVSIFENCPANKSNIKLEVSYGLAKDAQETFENLIVENGDQCSKEIIKFSPVPYTNSCNHKIFKKLASIVHYDLDLKFERVRECS